MTDITGLREDKRPQSSTIVHALLDRLEAAEEERDADRKIADTLALALNTSNHERDNLRAKIEAMEQQKPVGEIQRANSTGNYICSEVWVPLPVGSKLYALPGAQPAPSVPEGWKLVPIEPTPGMIDAAEYVDWGDADVRGSCINAWDRMLAATPEAKPCP